MVGNRVCGLHLCTSSSGKSTQLSEFEEQFARNMTAALDERNAQSEIYL
jgi:hypothetical protein